MLTIDLRLLSNGRPLSIEEFADLLAAKVAERLRPELQKLQHEPPKVTSGNPPARVASITRATQLLGLSRSTLWKHIQAKRLDTVRLGRRTFIRMESIERILRDGIRL